MLADGVSCGLHRIERLMRQQALRARPRRRRLPSDSGERQAGAVAPNVLERSFNAPAPNRRWIADFTYIWTAEGWLYVAAVIDLFSRRVVGWSMSASMTAELVTDALVMAIWRRGKPDALIHHSDRGSQYTSDQFQRLMAGYHAALAASGHDAETIALGREWSGVGKAVHVAETDEQARSEAEAFFIKNPSGAIARNADDMICGSPDTVTRKMRAFAESGVGVMTCGFLIDIENTAQLRRSVRLFKEEVIPGVAAA